MAKILGCSENLSELGMYSLDVSELSHFLSIEKTNSQA